jgi:hypothetical protein
MNYRFLGWEVLLSENGLSVSRPKASTWSSLVRGLAGCTT